ncbi:MAG: DMT family transporter [Candidatus Zixiibacteriota bacterium]|nr:MAG: DMT family transporter [candidate division Zixibacteria bacterium]
MFPSRPIPIAGEPERNVSTGLIVSVLLLQQTLGGLTFPVARFGLDFIEPFTFAFFRFVLSSTVLLIWVRLKRHPTPIEKKDRLKIVGLGFLIIPFNQTMYLVGQSLTGAGHGSLLFATVPIWILILALVHLRERPSLRRTAGIFIAMAGVVVVVASGAVEISSEYLWGDLIILVAVIAWAYYTILGKPLVRKYGALRVTAYALGSGSALYFPFGVLAASRFEFTGVPASAWWSIVYVALGVSVAAYVLWYWVLKYMEASRVAVFHNMQPLLAAGVAYVWLGEPLGLSFLVGGSIAIGGVVVAEL